jgi:integrase
MWVEMGDVMKRKGRHPERVLTAIKIRALKKPGRYADGNGLYLIVEPSGAKRWMLRTVVQERRRDLGLGGTQLVSLAEAREKAFNLRKVARAGGDPIAEKARAVVPTFAQAAQSAHTEHIAAWKNSKHAAQWISTLRVYAFPGIGTRRVDQVETPDVLKILSPIWLTKSETARRVKQRIGTVLDWANAAGFRAGENPVNGVAKGLAKQPDRRNHHATLPYAEVPSFIQDLGASENITEPTKLAFEFLILTAARTNEVLQAPWSEIKDRVWTLPPERTKAKREHRVPLSPQCLAVLRRAKELSDGSEYVFSGRSAGKPLSNTVFLMALRRMEIEVTAHGFRSAFRDWAAEQTSFSREVCEAALAHTIRDKTEAAYRRGDLFEKRRELMRAWADFLTSSPPHRRGRQSKSRSTKRHTR